MKYIYITVLFSFLATLLVAQGNMTTIVYEGEQSCANTKGLVLYQFNGVTMDKVALMPKSDSVQFSYQLPSSSNQFFYLGSAANNAKPVILGKEEKVVLKGNCRSFRSAIVQESDLNKAYAKVRDDMQQLNTEGVTIARQMQAAKGDPEQMKTLTEQSKVLDDKKLDLLINTDQQHPYLGKIVALNTYLSFQNNGKGYQSEYDYYANEFFKHVDWKDAEYQHNAWVFEAVKGYSETISMLNYPIEVHQELLESVLREIPAQSQTYQLALAAMVNGLKSKNHSNLAYFGEKFVEKYKNTAPAAARAIEKQIAAAKAFVIGATAPDFTQKTPEGEEMSLSDLKGKVVLVDFWASWCGPCRKENPNVVRMYEKYKAKGFEILGVSLDRQQSRWLQAIKADGLTWAQVSDLKGWQNEVAQIYGVRSIPSTVLVDAEGKILARDLRGIALERKLEEVFTER
ncbi:MAG: TlpA disulfide reductase family protein [Bacteroidota bacterium]